MDWPSNLPWLLVTSPQGKQSIFGRVSLSLQSTSEVILNLVLEAKGWDPCQSIYTMSICRGYTRIQANGDSLFWPLSAVSVCISWSRIHILGRSAVKCVWRRWKRAILGSRKLAAVSDGAPKEQAWTRPLCRSQVFESLFGSFSDTDGGERSAAWPRKVPFFCFGQNTYKPTYRSREYVQCPFEFTLHQKTYYGKCKSKLRSCYAVMGEQEFNKWRKFIFSSSSGTQGLVDWFLLHSTCLWSHTMV